MSRRMIGLASVCVLAAVAAACGSAVLIGLAVVVIVLLFLRGLWPPSEAQLQDRDASGTPAG